MSQDDERPDPVGEQVPAAAPEPAASPEPAAIATDPAAIATDPADVALLALVDRLAGLLDHSELSELEVQVGGTGLILRKPVAEPPALVTAAPGAAAAPPPGAHDGAAPSPGSGPAARPSVKAPLTGIWYGSPSPGTSAYVTTGGEVAAGQVIGLIEAMKLFNEIKSDLAGRVVKVHAEDGKLVKAKQPLIEVEPL